MARAVGRRAARSRGRFGEALASWRKLRGVSQEELAARSGVSGRHLSFLETGRAQPSREIALVLGQALGLPLRERNALLEAAGFAAAYTETSLEAPELEPVKRVLDWILAGCEPNGATGLDRGRNILRHNRAWRNQLGALVDLDALFGSGPLNSLRLLFHPLGLRNALENWEEIARAELSLLHAELRAAGRDPVLEPLLSELLAYPDVPRTWLLPAAEAAPRFVLPMHVRTPLGPARIFSTLTRMAAPRDVTLQELCVEALAPADAASEDVLARLGRGEVPHHLPRR